MGKTGSNNLKPAEFQDLIPKPSFILIVRLY